MFLRQSTAVVIQFGVFVDKTDGVTLETGLVSALDHGTTGILLSKNGGTLTIRHASVTASTYDAHGCYKVTLDTTDTNTVGSLRVIYTDATTCLPVWQDFQVVEEATYDALYASGALGPLTAAPGIVVGVVTSGATTTSIPTSSLTPAATVTDQFRGRIVIFRATTTSVNLRGQATDITGNTSGGILTVSALTNAPALGDVFDIY